MTWNIKCSQDILKDHTQCPTAAGASPPQPDDVSNGLSMGLAGSALLCHPLYVGQWMRRHYGGGVQVPTLCLGPTGRPLRRRYEDVGRV